LNTERTNTNTALTNVVSARQDITSVKTTKTTAINLAQGAFQQAKDGLALKLAKPRQADIDYYSARILQAQSQVDFLENQIKDSTLRSPVGGQVTAIYKEVGEMAVALSETAITILPTSFYEIAVDIYEEDIVKISLENPVDISFVTLPDQTFLGKVISINPGHKLVDGVVYYEVKIGFAETPQEIKQGMSADVFIRTLAKENVLVISRGAVEESGGKNTVRVYKDNKPEIREVTLGLAGFDGLVEVLSGLVEGEEIIIAD
jgi:multidrug efflux pump subunit AcrA (membrane-fusion protein)